MTTEGAQQEAVCAECGHGVSAHQEQDGALGVRAYCANCTQPDQSLWLHPFTPAPVVPSDGPRTFRLRALSQGGEGKA